MHDFQSRSILWPENDPDSQGAKATEDFPLMEKERFAYDIVVKLAGKNTKVRVLTLVFAFMILDKNVGQSSVLQICQGWPLASKHNSLVEIS